MEIGKTLYVRDKKAWRAWLLANHEKENAIWLIYPKKHSSRQRIPYNDAVEQALCFGWIDSTVKKLDSESFAQRFSRRNPKSSYSQTNKERLKEMAKQGLVLPHVLAKLGHIMEEEFAMPQDILKAIKADKDAWKHFRKFSERYVRIRVAFIDSARDRPAEFRKRLNHFLSKTARNKQFGFGGVEKYF